MLSAFDAWLSSQNAGLVLLVFLIICLAVFFSTPNQDTRNYRKIFHPKKKGQRNGRS